MLQITSLSHGDALTSDVKVASATQEMPLLGQMGTCFIVSTACRGLQTLRPQGKSWGQSHVSWVCLPVLAWYGKQRTTFQVGLSF